MSQFLKKLTFGIKDVKKKKVVEEVKSLSNITEDTLARYDEIREKLIGKNIKNEEAGKKKKKKTAKKNSIQIFSNNRKRAHGDDSSDESEEESNGMEHIEKALEKLIEETRRKNRIFTWGDDVPDIILRFSDTELDEYVLNKLNEFEIKSPSAIQMQSIPVMMSRRNILASAPTGSGKTLGFALPIIEDIRKMKTSFDYVEDKKILAIVLEPTRELAHQTYCEFRKYAPSVVKCSHFSDDDLQSGADIIVSTPNRIVYHLKDIDTSALRWLVVDESDRLFEVIEGQERCFRNQLAEIYKACDAKCTRIAMFSATFSYEVEKWCKDNIDNVAMVCIGERNSSNANVKQELKYCATEEGKKIEIRNLLKTQFKPPALIFVQSKERALQLVKLLSAIDHKLKVDSITSEKSDKERDETMERFRNGKIWVLICTELLGRGLDISDVELVINYDLPTSIVSYIHRVGRTGRAGNVGRAITYFTDGDIKLIKSIAMVIKQSGFDIPEYLMEMKKLSRDRKNSLKKHAPKRSRIAMIDNKVLKKTNKKNKKKKKNVDKKDKKE